MRIRERFVRWYFRRVIGRCCPCEWPVKSRTLIRWCGRMDDAYDRLVFIDFARHYMAQTYSKTSGTNQVVESWKVER